MHSNDPPEQGKGAVDAMASDIGSDADRWQRTAVGAFFRAQARGFAPGGELDDWLAAERDLIEADLDVNAAVQVAAVESAPAKLATPAKAAAKKAAPAKRSTRTRKSKSGMEAGMGGAG